MDIRWIGGFSKQEREWSNVYTAGSRFSRVGPSLPFDSSDCLLSPPFYFRFRSLTPYVQRWRKQKWLIVNRAMKDLFARKRTFVCNIRCLFSDLCSSYFSCFFCHLSTLYFPPLLLITIIQWILELLWSSYVGLVRLKLSPVKFVLFTLLLLAISISIETGHSAIRFCNKTEFETFMTLL